MTHLATLMHVQEFGSRTEVEQHRNELIETYVNLYKDRYGFKPRDILQRAQNEGWTILDWHDEVFKLNEEV